MKKTDRLDREQRVAADDGLFPANRPDPVEATKLQIVGTSKWALSAPSLVAARAAQSTPFIISGERGTGKQLVAQLVHNASARSDRQFVVLPVDGFGEDVLLDLLFESPASLSPAVREFQNEYIDRARGGTIYVSEIEGMSGSFHQRVQQFVDDGQNEHVRRRWMRACGIRLVFGVSDDVAYPMTSGTVVQIPPLRERLVDIVPLAELFALSLSARLGREPRALSECAVSALEHYAWPGNIGELKRVVEQSVRRAGPPELALQHLPAHIAGLGEAVAEPVVLSETGVVLNEVVRRYERQLLTSALERCGGVQTRAAQLLGMKVSTLNSKLASFRIDPAQFKGGRPRRTRLTSATASV